MWSHTSRCYKLPYLLSVQAMVFHALDRKPNLGTVGHNIKHLAFHFVLGNIHTIPFLWNRPTNSCDQPLNHTATQLVFVGGH